MKIQFHKGFRVKKLSAAFVFMAASASGAALAQTSVSSAVVLYGRLDTSIESVRFSDVRSAPDSSAVNLSKATSYWGLRGQESLGGGMRAYFKLESGFFVDTGASGSSASLFNREAYVGLGSNIGSLQLGSQYAPSLLLTTKVDPFQRIASGSIINLMQQSSGNRSRGYLGVQNNAIHYISPTTQGMTARAFYGLSERSTAPRDLGSFASLALDYQNGPFFVGVTAEDQSVAGDLANTSVCMRTYTLGATYDLKFIKLTGYLLKNDLEAKTDVNAYLVGFVLPLGPGQVRSSYASRETRNVPGARANVISLGYTYDLSKRTVLYTTYSRLQNDFESTSGLLPSIRTYSPALKGQDIASLEVGLRHNF